MRCNWGTNCDDPVLPGLQRCEAHQEKMRAYQRAHYWRNVSTRRATKRRLALKVYGLTLADYDAMLESQGGVCAICRRTCESGRRLCVDHDHATGEVRGLLCNNCNRCIGLLRDDPEILRRGAEYLEVSRDVAA